MFARGPVRTEWPESPDRWLFGSAAKSLFFRLMAWYQQVRQGRFEDGAATFMYSLTEWGEAAVGRNCRLETYDLRDLSKIEKFPVRIPLLKGEGGPKGRVRGKDLISLPLTRRFAAPSPFRRGIRPGNFSILESSDQLPNDTPPIVLGHREKSGIMESS